MFDTIIVGHDGGDGGRDALALGRMLARATGAELVAAHVYDTGAIIPPPEYARWGAIAYENAQQMLTEALGDAADVRAELVQSPSVARGLHEFAEREQADLLVVGSSRHAGLGRVLAGSAGERTLHGSPCGVAVAPAGYRDRSVKLETVAVGFDGLPESEAALLRATDLARSAGARLELLALVERPEIPSESKGAVHAGESDLARSREEHMRAQLDRGLTTVPAGVPVSAELVGGHTEALAEREGIDVLVVGSRGYGPLRRVLLGSVATHLVRSAPCPVIVYPRSATATNGHTEPEPAETSSRT